jgi:hypothetical protein
LADVVQARKLEENQAYSTGLEEAFAYKSSDVASGSDVVWWSLSLVETLEQMKALPSAVAEDQLGR